MRIAFCLIMIGVLMACSKVEKTNYLQSQKIQVAAPRLEATDLLIDSFVVLTAELKLEGVKIRYTKDGTVPTEKSDEYKTPLKVETEGEYRFMAFHPEWKPSEWSEIKLYRKGIVPQRIEWHSSASNSYPGIGKNTLMNQKRSSVNFRDEQWAGYDSIMSATIFFEKDTFLNSINIGYLIDSKSWILPPSQISLISSRKDTITKKWMAFSEEPFAKMENIILPIGKKISWIEVEVVNAILPNWHIGKGSKAWLFMDEWVFN